MTRNLTLLNFFPPFSDKKTAIGTMIFVKVNLRATIKKRQLAYNVGENSKKLLAPLVVGILVR
jgi:hypothetical protein